MPLSDSYDFRWGIYNSSHSLLWHKTLEKGERIFFFHISTYFNASTHLISILILSFTLTHCVKVQLLHCARLQHKIRGNYWVSSGSFKKVMTSISAPQNSARKIQNNSIQLLNISTYSLNKNRMKCSNACCSCTLLHASVLIHKDHCVQNSAQLRV